VIPSMSGSGAVPPSTGNLLFHVTIDDFNRVFWMDGPDGPNGIRLHYQMMQVAREQKNKLRDFDLWANSQDTALALMKNHFSDYTHLGTWATRKRVE
jgi:hypothetical protein